MKKVVLVIMDGVGYSENSYGNAVKNATTPTLDLLMKKYPSTLLFAHGTHVGLPSDKDMGNSEVGHNTMGCGQIYPQGAKLVNEAINSGEIFKSNTWKELITFSKNNTLHLIGLLSDGNVHSNINHLFALIFQAKKEKIKKVRIHVLLDGRDTPERSALQYINALLEKLNELNDKNFDAKIASGGGRMKITMDRYEADYKMVEKGWHTHVLGDARHFKSATEAIETMRMETNEIDQNLESFVIVDDNDKPIGKIEDNDSVIFFNFRGDRAIEISKCFDEKEFDKFNRLKVPKVYYAGMLEYDSEAKIPKHFLTEPPKIKNTLTEELCKHNIYEYAISETQKYGHVTYFWNGNRQDKFNEKLETYDIVPSDIIPFDLKPEMKSYEITDKLIDAIKSNKYDFLRINFPNGDMVGHTGNYNATVKAMEAVDKNIDRILKTCIDNNYILIVTADHGNAEEMYDGNNQKTSHSLNKVPFIIATNNINFKIKDGNFGLANVASTITTLLDLPKNPVWEESIIEKE